MKRTLLLSLLALSLTACSQDNPVPTPAKPSHDTALEVEFTIKIDNLSNATDLSTAFSPLVWQVGSQAFFSNGQPAGANLERLAEDGNPDLLLASLSDSLKGNSLRL